MRYVLLVQNISTIILTRIIVQEKAKAKGKKGSRRERSKTMKKVMSSPDDDDDDDDDHLIISIIFKFAHSIKAPKKRGALFSEPIEKMTIAMKELFNIFG